MTDPQFYQQPPWYWEQVGNNLASWVGVQHVTALDVIILLALFPLSVIGIIWLMPWENWVWRNVPKTILGPYLLYCAFAFWHFMRDTRWCRFSSAASWYGDRSKTDPRSWENAARIEIVIVNTVLSERLP